MHADKVFADKRRAQHVIDVLQQVVDVGLRDTRVEVVSDFRQAVASEHIRVPPYDPSCAATGRRRGMSTPN